MAIEIAPADAGARTNENCSGSVVAILTASFRRGSIMTNRRVRTMRYQTVLRRCLMGYSLVYCISWGQPGFRYPVGDSVFAGAYANALRVETTQTSVKPITSEVACASGALTAALDQNNSTGPATLGGGTGIETVGAMSDSCTVARGNKAWIEINCYGGSSGVTFATVRNEPPSCSFALQVAISEGGNSEEFNLPFIMPEAGPVVLILGWADPIGSSSGPSGECGGLFAEASFSYSFSAGYSVYITDSNGATVFAEEFSTREFGQRYFTRELFLPAGQYRIFGTSGVSINCTSVAVVNPYPPRCTSCTMAGVAGVGEGLAVALVAYRRTIPVPLEAVRSDIDGNYRVDDGDMLSVLAEYGNDGLGTLADINNDGHVDDADFLIVLQYFGTEY